MNGVDKYEDAFGNPEVRTPNNLADLGGMYPYNPERYRFYRNGDRELLLYEIANNGDLQSYPYLSDTRPSNEDVFILQPDPGDTLTFKTAERFRYRVGYVHQLSASLGLSQSLQNPNDRATLGLATGPTGHDLTDGYFFEQTADHDDKQGDFFERRNGNTIGERKTVSLNAAITAFSRIYLDYNWYNIGEESWAESYTTSNDGQLNSDIARTSVEPQDENSGPGGRGPISGNGHIAFQLEADPATTGLEAYVGSYGMLAKGDVDTVVRKRGIGIGDYTPTQTGSWEAVCALRRDPSNPNVTVEFPQITNTLGTGKTLLLAVDPTNVRKADGSQLQNTDFRTPEERHPANTVVERTDIGVIDEWPDDTGTLGSIHDTPGGYQLQFSTTRVEGQDLSESKSEVGTKDKHGIRDGDIALLVTKPYTTDTRTHSAPEKHSCSPSTRQTS